MNEEQITKIRERFTAAVLRGDEGSRDHTLRKSVVELVQKYTATGDVKDGTQQVRPWSHDDFIARLKTFQHSAAWFAKPACIGPLECSRHGWCNSGIDELTCHSCGVTVVHAKEDPSGETLRAALRSGHLAHCGWTDNFCPATFLGFPTTGPALLREHFLRRWHAALQALAAAVGGAAGSGGSWTFVVDASVGSSAPALSDFLLGEKGAFGSSGGGSSSSSSGGGRGGGSGHITFSAAAAEASRSALCTQLAAAARCVEDMQTRHRSGAASGVGAEGPALPADAAPVLTEMRAVAAAGGGADDVQGASAAVRAGALLALCGWTAVPAPVPSSSQGPAVVGAVNFRCDLCGRSFPLSSFATAGGAGTGPTSTASSASPSRRSIFGPGHDPLAQHRAFCVWARVEEGVADVGGDDLSLSLSLATGSDAAAEVAACPRLPGWLHCARALVGDGDGNGAGRSAADVGIGGGASAGQGQVRSASQMLLRGEADTAQGTGSEDYVDAEQAYKRIKRIMSMAAVKRPI